MKMEELVKYWKATAEHDYDTMLVLFRNKKYSDSLFYGHIILEKILKGLVVRESNKEAPYIHDLVRLQEIAKIYLPEEEVMLLNRVNDFNIRARYPEYKLKFYRSWDKDKTKDYLDKIIKLYKKLCRKLMQKK